MDKNLKGLKPALVWKHFAEIVQIPRPSSHEEQIRAYIIAFAKEQGLVWKEDAAHNIYVAKPASEGMENRVGVVIQAHLDMVPQKNNDKQFDFEKDPIEAYIDGEWVTANGTTLGADNGIGVAAILAVLEDKTLVHGPVEALFTATEETGMDGAFGLEGGMLQGDILLNLDSETEGELYVGCAGGMDASATFDYQAEPVPAGDYVAMKLVAKGMKGGHSGPLASPGGRLTCIFHPPRPGSRFPGRWLPGPARFLFLERRSPAPGSPNVCACHCPWGCS